MADRLILKRKMIGMRPEKGTYSPGTDTALVNCPGCGRFASLRDHEIKPNGEVEPSLVCPYPDCDFHEFVTLEDWPHE